MTPIERAVSEVTEELARARTRFPRFNSSHEGYAVLLEEVDELWDEIKRNDPVRGRCEAIQVAAMAIRLILDCYTDPDAAQREDSQCE
jgi:hypothetical protein